MDQEPGGWRGIVFDGHLAATFLLHVPLPPLPQTPSPQALARAMRVFPLVGACIGGGGGLVYALAVTVGLTPLLAALLALAAISRLTGGLHEDGLADMADGFGATVPRPRKLEILRDSRIGTFGVLALVFGVTLRAAAVAAVGTKGVDAVVVALVVAESMGRAAMPLVMRFAPPARPDGLGAAVAAADQAKSIVATVIAVATALVLALVLLPPGPAGGAGLAMGIAVGWVTVSARRHIGGYTGDVLGAAGYAAASAVLISLARA
ncbi:MAG: adenosylcobinamide-GDP ribazoletransferase [Rhodospirillaceae bacterium]|nr:MAG: adenosylcobinamide-GDP ribazoletransferase [Rhodospirillaceae bacterium]